MLTHNEACIVSHFGSIHVDDRLCTGEPFMVVSREMALR